ncbi:hypothetical protein B0T19DRAFT_438713 [Cercophora scortea]|uniref:Heterokaryon incompatibility domain-containing protein n=1 Tax=Cercophora scortea TaxID=314031 RepID=A0AAE0MHF1_9PEZI|nr:hypothetical protein B0T19DRAFT_438713 [Cercophora scortea]
MVFMTPPAQVYGPVSSRFPRTVSSQLCNLCLDFEQNYARPQNIIQGNEFDDEKIFAHHATWSALKQSSQDGCQLCTLFMNGHLHTSHSRRSEELEHETLLDTDLRLTSAPTPGGFQVQRWHTAGGHRLSYLAANARSWATSTFAVAIDVGACQPLLETYSESYVLRLVATDPSTKYEYVSLSQRWGSVISGCESMTTRDNIDDRMKPEGFRVPNMCATFEDAITAAKLLGFEYIWIAQMCIIQNDTLELQSESPRIASVYRGAALTIACPTIPDKSPVGFLQRERETLTNPLYQPCEIQYRNEIGDPEGSVKVWYPGCIRKAGPGTAPSQRFRWPDRILNRQPDSTVLGNRGWVVQERLLSRRILYFGAHEMYFECLHSQQYESTHGEMEYGAIDGLRLSKRVPHFTSSSRSDYSLWWLSLVRRYAGTELSIPTDRLPALSGVIHAIPPPLPDTYLAGIWKSDLPHALIWRSKIGADCYDQIGHLKQLDNGELASASAGAGTTEYVAPSRSWASSSKPVEHILQERSPEVTWFLDNLSCSTMPADPSPAADPYGRVKSGSLRVRGKLRKAVVARLSRWGQFRAFLLPFAEHQTEKTGNRTTPVRFYADDVSQYASVPVDYDEKNRLTAEEVRDRQYPELFALQTALHVYRHGFGVAIALEALPGMAGVFRRVGLLQFDFLVPKKTMAHWYDGVEQKDIEIV